MEKLLTLIIPTYNMENYLHQCLDSVIFKDSIFKSLEILVINDGSKDSSLAIAKKYAEKYPDVIKAVDKPNGNYGSCINAGLPIASGKYVKILDSDDSFNTSILPEFLNLLSSIEVDIVFTDFDIVNENGKILDKRRFRVPINRMFNLDDCITNERLIFMHGITYRTSLLNEMNYRQTEGISYTDTEWAFIPLQKTRSAYYFPHVLYKYLVGREGQTMAGNVIHSRAAHRFKILKNIVLNYKTDEDLNIPIGIRSYRKNFINHQIRSLYRSYILHNNDKKGFAELDKFVRSTTPEFIQISNEYTISQYIPFRYVKHMRDKGKFPPKIYLNLFKWLRKINQRINTPL